MFLASRQTTDHNSNTQKDADDPRIRALKKVIKWQSRIFILLAMAFVATLAFYAMKIEITLPEQQAVQEAPPIAAKDVQFNTFAYHNTDLLQDGATVDMPEILLMGQIYDFAVIKKQWPDIRITLNDATVELQAPSGSYKTDFTLKPGKNVIETAIYWTNANHGKQQFVINYIPKK